VSPSNIYRSLEPDDDAIIQVYSTHVSRQGNRPVFIKRYHKFRKPFPYKRKSRWLKREPRLFPDSLGIPVVKRSGVTVDYPLDFWITPDRNSLMILPGYIQSIHRESPHGNREMLRALPTQRNIVVHGFEKLKTLRRLPFRRTQFESLAALVQLKGDEKDGNSACDRCQKGKGIFNKCVFVAGVGWGGCANCLYTNDHRWCTAAGKSNIWPLIRFFTNNYLVERVPFENTYDPLEWDSEFSCEDDMDVDCAYESEFYVEYGKTEVASQSLINQKESDESPYVEDMDTMHNSDEDAEFEEVDENRLAKQSNVNKAESADALQADKVRSTIAIKMQSLETL